MNEIEIQLKKRNKKFAHGCVKLVSELAPCKLSYHTEGQLIRCSTSVAANYRAACISQSTKSFIAKLSIVIEEADESDFWLEFILDENLHPKPQEVERLMKEAQELTKIYISSRLTMSKNQKSGN